MRIAVIGATSKTGRPLVERLRRDGHEVLAIGRDPSRLASLGSGIDTAIVDLARPPNPGNNRTRAGALADSLAGVDCVVSLAHARFTGVILDALPATGARLVLTGSTRIFSALPDPAADAVRAGEAAFLAAGRPGIMLHPSMIYGTPGDRNINRILDWLRRFPRWLPVPVPLPGGGRQRLQPVFIDDLVEAFVAAILCPEPPAATVVVAGPEAIPYADIVRACGRALGRRVVILPLPLALLAGGLGLARALGLKPPVTAAEARRAAEDRVCDIVPLRDRLGVTPRPFDEGLGLRLARLAGEKPGEQE